MSKEGGILGTRIYVREDKNVREFFTPKNTRIKYYKYKTPPLVVVTTLGVRSREGHDITTITLTITTTTTRQDYSVGVVVGVGVGVGVGVVYCACSKPRR